MAAWNAQNGFDEPIIVQYWHYVYALLHGDLGYSYKLNQPVAALFAYSLHRIARAHPAELSIRLN